MLAGASPFVDLERTMEVQVACPDFPGSPLGVRVVC